VVSGGHTQLVLIEEKKAGTALSEGRRPAQRDKVGVGARERKAVPVFDYKIIGETRDDAAGEAFDKVAKMLGLGYPGGPIISRLASQSLNHSITQSLSLPRPMLHSGDFDFSFSGLKTAVLYALQKLTPAQLKQQTPAVAAEFQQAVIDVLTAKTLAAARKNNAKTIILAGGVAANAALRQNLKAKSAELKINFLSPPLELCADNAVMIALAALQKNAKKTAWQALKAEANLRIL